MWALINMYMIEGHMEPIKRHAQMGGSTTLTITLLLFIALVGCGTWAVYNFAEESTFVIGDSTLEDLALWEVVGGVAIGVIAAILGILAGLVGIVIGLVAAALSIALSLLGTAIGLFVVAGVLAGPILLLAAVIILINRSSRPKYEAPIQEQVGSSTEEIASA